MMHPTLKFMLVGVLIMGGVFVLNKDRPSSYEVTYQPVTQAQAMSSLPEDEIIDALEVELELEILELFDELEALAVQEIDNVPDRRPRIVIMIDDLGVSKKYTRKVIALPAPLTLSYLPYPKGIQGLVDEGVAAGHAIMMHMPMEAIKSTLDESDYVLRVESDSESFYKTLVDNLESFTGYSGINNHMGSRLTQDEDKMNQVMEELAARDLFFVDSKTINSSVAAKLAEEQGLSYAVRDVFLDHDESMEGINKALDRIETIARKNGIAIAIGHPKSTTISALESWLPTLAVKGLRLVPIEDVLLRPQTDGQLAQ